MAFPSLQASSEEQIRPRNCVLRLIVSCPTRQNHPPAYAGIQPMYCERSNTSRDYCANETVRDRVWNCGSDAENVRDVSNTIAGARGGSMSAAPSPQGILSTAARGAARRWLSRTVAILYGLVMFEVIIMISPFAFYFYAAYGPTLKWLNHSRATAWLTGFVLPHAVFTTSPFLEFLRWDLGRYAFGLGLVGFFFFAVQIYGSRLFRRKVMTSGVYRYIRHPQYLCLNISAFGLFTMWPRVIIFYCLWACSLPTTSSRGWKSGDCSNSSSWIRRVHAWHGHVPAGQSRRARLRVAIWRHAQSVARPSTGDWKLGVGAPSDRHWAACVYAGAYLALDRCSEHGSHLGIPDDP